MTSNLILVTHILGYVPPELERTEKFLLGKQVEYVKEDDLLGLLNNGTYQKIFGSIQSIKNLYKLSEPEIHKLEITGYNHHVYIKKETYDELEKKKHKQSGGYNFINYKKLYSRILTNYQ